MNLLSPNPLLQTAKFSFLIALTASPLVFGRMAYAEDLFFGGKPERFAGAGDKQPPSCQLNSPSSAGDDFFVSWNCVDQFNNTPQAKIRSAIWIKRADDPRYFKVDDFLGFPASLQINRGLLKLSPEAEFRSGLPIAIRIEASDTAGITTITDPFTVQPRTNSLSTCSLSLVTAPTESTGDSTGTPSSEVRLTDVSVTLSNVSETGLTVATTLPLLASPCELSTVCDDSEKVTFSAAVKFSSDSTASASLSVSPGSVAAELTGSFSQSDTLVSGFELSGLTNIEGTATTASLACSGTASSTALSNTINDSTINDSTVVDSSEENSTDEVPTEEDTTTEDTSAEDSANLGSAGSA